MKMSIQMEKTMATELASASPEKQNKKAAYRGGASETVYGLGFLGALVYYVGHATTIWIGLLGLLKAVFWPAVLVYEALRFFGG
jgi:hypothetical protein